MSFINTVAFLKSMGRMFDAVEQEEARERERKAPFHFVAVSILRGGLDGAAFSRDPLKRKVRTGNRQNRSKEKHMACKKPPKTRPKK